MCFGLHHAESLHDEAHNLQQHSWWELWPVPLLTQLSQRVIGRTEELGRPADLPVLLQGEGQWLWEFGLTVLLQTAHLDNKRRTDVPKRCWTEIITVTFVEATIDMLRPITVVMSRGGACRCWRVNGPTSWLRTVSVSGLQVVRRAGTPSGRAAQQRKRSNEELLLILDPSYMNGSAVSPASYVHMQLFCI